MKRASESVPCPGFTKRTTIYCSYFLFVSARARGAARFEEPGLRGRAHMSSPAGSTRSNINSMTGALAPRTRSGATYGSGAAAPSTPVRGPALRLVDPEDAALRRASADVPSFLEQAEGTVPQGALQRSAGLTADLGQLFEALEHGFPGYEHPVRRGDPSATQQVHDVPAKQHSTRRTDRRCLGHTRSRCTCSP